MTKRDLVIKIAQQTDLTQNEVKTVIEGILGAIIESLAKGEKVELRDFGVFKVKGRKERVGRNPRTGETVPIGAKKVAYFKSGKLMKEEVEKA